MDFVTASAEKQKGIPLPDGYERLIAE